MKKQILVIAMMIAGTWILLPSCSPNAEKEQGLQAPALSQAETPGSAASNLNVSEAKAATIKNLKAAFAGETTASAKYAAYSKKAQEEGLNQIALLFKATSESEKIHANNHRSVLEDMGEKVDDIKPEYLVKSTKENLADAITGESYEIATMYPAFLSAANKADNQLALTSLNYAYRTEQRHKPLYEKAQAALQSNQLATLSGEYYVCPTCGNTYDTTPPQKCRISMTSSERFVKITSV